MEEKVNEILGMGSEDVNLEGEVMKAVPDKPTIEKRSGNGAENTLITIANIILLVGIIVTVICFFTICYVKEDDKWYSEKVFNPSGFATTLMILLSSLISWSVMRVLANISLTLKEINGKIKKE